MSYPVYLDQSPQPNFIGVQIDAPVFFRIQDSYGLKLNTLEVTVDGQHVIVSGAFQFGFSGAITQEDHIPTSLSIVVQHNSFFRYSSSINVTIHIENSLGTIGRCSYSFITVSNPDIEPPNVMANPRGALFNHALTVKLLDDDPSATVYYTLDGTDPSLISSKYQFYVPAVPEVPATNSTPLIPLIPEIPETVISISNEGSTKLKFVCVDSANNSSKIVLEKYVIDTVAPITQVSIPGGNYFGEQVVVLTANEADSTIYYTLNGIDPDANAKVYSTPIQILKNAITTLKFRAVDKALNWEAIHTEVYTIEIAKNNYIPTNVFATCPYNQSEIHILWDDMWPMYNKVIGYNVYRADLEMGPYEKLNERLLAITQYIDKTLDTQIVNEDISEQFKRTVSISRDVDDNFSGVGCFDNKKWKELDKGELLFKYNGIVFKDSVGLKQESKLVSAFKLRSDFEIVIKYELCSWNAPKNGIESSIFRVKTDDLNYVQISREHSHTKDLYTSVQSIGGNIDLPVTIQTIDYCGMYRIIRVGNVITTYFWDHGNQQYVEISHFDGHTEDMYIEIVGKSSDIPIEIKWTDFKVVSGSPIIIQPMTVKREYVFATQKRPIVDWTGSNNPTDNIEQIDVTIDGKRAYIKKLQGIEGVVYLDTDKKYDEVKGEFFEPPVPNEFSKVLITYRTPLHKTSLRLRKNYFYKVTCVTAEDETDLDLISSEYVKPDKMDYIMEEAVRRNSWMLEQGGERVLLYIKKRAGVPCHCVYRDLKERVSKKPDQDCITCFGSGFEGGFDGPYPISIGPLMTEQKIMQTDRGLKLMYQVESWTGPAPLVNQKDMIIRRNGDRCLLGPITPVEGPGGVRVQQHFVIEILDGTDIRYKFNVNPLPDQASQPGIDKRSKSTLRNDLNVAAIESPKESEEFISSEDKVSHENKNVDRVVRGRSIVFENKNY
jgi:hypothetical protein